MGLIDFHIDRPQNIPMIVLKDGTRLRATQRETQLWDELRRAEAIIAKQERQLNDRRLNCNGLRRKVARLEHRIVELSSAQPTKACPGCGDEIPTNATRCAKCDERKLADGNEQRKHDR